MVVYGHPGQPTGEPDDCQISKLAVHPIQSGGDTKHQQSIISIITKNCSRTILNDT
jgi:hypothetical protein